MFCEWQVSIHPSSCLSHLSQDESDASPGGHARHLGSIACNHCQGLLELAHCEVYCLLHSHREYTPHLFRLCIVVIYHEPHTRIFTEGLSALEMRLLSIIFTLQPP